MNEVRNILNKGLRKASFQTVLEIEGRDKWYTEEQIKIITIVRLRKVNNVSGGPN